MNFSCCGQQPLSSEAEPGKVRTNVKSPLDSTPGFVPAHRPGLGSRFPRARGTFLLDLLYDPLSQDLIP